MIDVSVYSNGIDIRVDRRTTLLSIIEILSNYRKRYPFLLEKYGNKDYVEEIETQFLKYKNHKVIKLFDELILKYDFSFSAPIILFLQLNEDFTINHLQSHPFETRLHSDSIVLELLQLLPAFAKKINFETFYTSNSKRYLNFIYSIQTQLKGLNITEFMMNYYGITDNKEFIVNLIPWRTYGCYGTSNGDQLYTHLCCHHKSKEESEIYPTDDQVFDYSTFLIHEFSHSFVNPITDRYSLISEKDIIFNDIRDQMQQLGYGSNKSILNDHIVRAVTLRYLYVCGKDLSYYHKQLETDKSWGFVYIENILDSLTYYENHRSAYKTFEDFYPVIIQNMKQMNGRKKL